MATKESVKPVVQALRLVSDNLKQAAKLLENNHEVLPDHLVEVMQETFTCFMNASGTYCESVKEAVHHGHELGKGDQHEVAT